MEEDVGDDGSTILDGVRIPPAPPTITNSNDSNTTRLLITRIVCENFKSYAGKRILGPFHSSFSSIVGPNGSGKSNVIDAMLFVFGFRAQKIRSKRVSVLIHNSSEHPDVNSCTVSVHFGKIQDNENEIISGSEFYVSRTAFKDNSSFYEVNGEKRSFKAVSQLLKAQGIDLDHNRFLILQGEVEQIALMKPKSPEGSAGGEGSQSGMLEFLEDIIGSSRLKEPIETFKQRVSDLDEQRSEKLNRVKLVEKEKDELESPKNEALNYLKLENEIISMKNTKYQAEAYKCRVKLESVEKKKLEFQESSKDVLEKLESISQEKRDLEDVLTGLNNQVDDLTSKLEETKEKFKNHELEDSKLMEDMKNTNIKRKRIMQSSKLEKERYEKLKLIPETNSEKIEECRELREKLERAVEEERIRYDEALRGIKAETQEFQDQKETQETKLIDLRKCVNDAESKVVVAQSSLEIEESKERKEKSKLETLELNLRNLKEGLSQKEDELRNLETEETPDTKDRIRIELETISDKIENLRNQVKTARMTFEETKSNQQATKAKGKVHGALMEQKAIGNLPGIYGRLGDLGTIDSKYDVAVSTAGGSALDTIIVDTVETGKACIQYLRKYDVGRANFLALEKIKVNFNSFKNVKNDVVRLFDLITVVDSIFKPAFYHYLRDTLIASEMNEAQRLAFDTDGRRYRVVTLDGEVIEKSGAMSGGGRERSRGKMGISSIKTTGVTRRIDGVAMTQNVDLNELERKLRQKEDTLNEALRTKTQLEETQAEMERRYKERRELKTRIELECTRSKDELTLLMTRCKEQRKIVTETRTDPDKVKTLKRNLNQYETERNNAVEAARSVEDVVTKLNKRIKDIMGSKVKVIQKRLDDASTQLDKVKREMTRLEVEIKSSERDLSKCKDKFTNYDTEITDAENKMRTMKTQREELEKVGKELFESLDRFKTERKRKGRELETRTREFDKIKEIETQHRSSRIEIEQKLAFYDESIKEETRNESHFRKEVQKLKLVEIPGGAETTELKRYSEDELRATDLKKLQYQKTILEENLAALKPNLAAIAEFKRKEGIYLERAAELDELTKRRDRQRRHYEELRKMRLNEFMEGFTVITAKLKEMYQMITLGGDAELELVDSLDPFTEGIVFSVRPPKKSWKNISNLSGGEKTLSSLALVFALHYYKPTPLYVMDEIDAALDFKNVSIVANYIKERTRNAQFIIISLRSNMFELADRLIGIYKTSNATKSITLDPAAMVNKERRCL